MGKQQVLLAFGSVLGTSIVGVGAMMFAGLDPSYGIPLMIVGALMTAACFSSAWILSSVADESKVADDSGNFLPDLRAVDSEAVKDILAHKNDRQKFVEQMRNGTLTTWAHCKGLQDLQRLSPNHWDRASLAYEAVNGTPVTNVLPNHEKRTRPWSKEPIPARLEHWHDVYFSEEQLKKHWPDNF